MLMEDDNGDPITSKECLFGSCNFIISFNAFFVALDKDFVDLIGLYSCNVLDKVINSHFSSLDPYIYAVYIASSIVVFNFRPKSFYLFF